MVCVPISFAGTAATIDLSHVTPSRWTLDAAGRRATAAEFFSSDTSTLEPHASFGAALVTLVALERARRTTVAGVAASAAAESCPELLAGGIYAERVQQLRAESNESTPAHSPRGGLSPVATGAAGPHLPWGVARGAEGRVVSRSRATRRAIGAIHEIIKGPRDARRVGVRLAPTTVADSGQASLQVAGDACAAQSKVRLLGSSDLDAGGTLEQKADASRGVDGAGAGT